MKTGKLENLMSVKLSSLWMMVFAVSLLMFASSCSKEGCTDPKADNYDSKAKSDDGTCIYDHDHDHVDIHYAFATVGGAWPDQTTFIQGTENIGANLTNANATELANWGQMWTYGHNVFMTRFGAPATMFKYTFNESGVAVLEGEIIIPGANTFSTIEFISDTEAYGTVAGGLARVIKFNPQTFRVTGEIDLTPILRDSVESYWYLGMKARDGKLFMGVEYQNSWASTYDSAFVAVIDLTTSTVEKVISDPRTGMIFTAGGAIQGFNLDDNGDIYLIGNGTANTPSGVLRIKSGETEFDPTYFMDLDAVTGNPCQGLWHFPGVGTFTLRMNDPTDPWEFNGPNYKYYKLDLTAQTATEIGAPITKGSSTSIMRKFDDSELLFVISNDNKDAVYSYDISTGALKQKFKADGMISGFQKLEE